MNIVSVNKYYWLKGGSESVFFSEKKMLESAGHLVIPFSMQGDHNVPTSYEKYFVSNVDYDLQGIINRISSAAKIIYSYEAKKKIDWLLKDYSADLAHFHIFQHQISPSVFGPMRKRNIPIVLTLHDLKPVCPNYQMYVNGNACEACKGRKFYNCFINRCTKGSLIGSLVNTIEMYFHYAMGYYQNVDRYIAVSKFHMNKMIEYGFDKDQISYLPNYIDATSYDPTISSKDNVLYFGRLSSEKGVSVLLDAAKSLPNISFNIVGTGPQESVLIDKCNAENIDNVSFLGYKTGDDLKKILSQAACVVVPSEVYENCPMTILEAFAAGRPVIGSDIGGIPELIEEGVDGFTFPPGDSTALAEKISWIWDNRAAARDMGMAGRKKVEERFNAKVHYDGLISIYNSVLGN